LSSANPLKVSVYIDGFNLYHAILAERDHKLKWLNMRLLAQSFVGRYEILKFVVFFTAILTWNHEKQKRHKNYIAALKAVGVEIVESNFKRIGRKNYEEKQTDVQIALRMYQDAVHGGVDRLILVTADSDQVPTVRAIRERCPYATVTLAAPPGRETAARELGSIVHHRTPISSGRLRTCLLPRDVYDSAGRKVATMPALYAERFSD